MGYAVAIAGCAGSMKKEAAMNNQPSYAKPPEAPQIPRRFELYAYQYIGILLLLVVPVLALLGVFGESATTLQQASADLTLTITYPTRYRYEMLNSLTAAVRNNTSAAIPTLTVRFSRDYIDQFSDVSFSPSLTRITDEAYEVDLSDLPPGAARVVSVDLRADAYGEHRGAVTAAAEGLEPAGLMVSTLVFP